MHISLTDRLDQYVRDQVASGLYSNVSEVIRDALRDKVMRSESEEMKKERLRAALEPAIKQAKHGESTPFDFDELNARLDREYGSRA